MLRIKAHNICSEYSSVDIKRKKKEGLLTSHFLPKLLSACLLFQPTSAFFILVTSSEDKDFWICFFIYKCLQRAVFPKTHVLGNSGVLGCLNIQLSNCTNSKAVSNSKADSSSFLWFMTALSAHPFLLQNTEFWVILSRMNSEPVDSDNHHQNQQQSQHMQVSEQWEE